uniref:Retinol dehydrogenase 14 n=1 Tax=Aegilops tauschii TaxID=37682 RepID=M8C647_AEGTA
MAANPTQKTRLEVPYMPLAKDLRSTKEEGLQDMVVETAAATGMQGRIVNVSSSVHGWFSGDWADYLQLVTRRKIPYDATQAYAVSKLANVLHTKELAARLQEMGADVTVNCVHPGIVRTRLNREREGLVTDLAFVLLSKLLKTIPQASLVGPRFLLVAGSAQVALLVAGI